MGECMHTAHTYGPYVRVHFLTPVRTGHRLHTDVKKCTCTYRPHVRVVRISLKRNSAWARGMWQCVSSDDHKICIRYVYAIFWSYVSMYGTHISYNVCVCIELWSLTSALPPFLSISKTAVLRDEWWPLTGHVTGHESSACIKWLETVSASKNAALSNLYSSYNKKTHVGLCYMSVVMVTYQVLFRS